jgi:hypothetical protein
VLPDSLRSSLRASPEILPQRIPLASPTAVTVTSPLWAKAVIRARIARVDSPTSAAICCEENPERLPAEIDKPARIFCVPCRGSYTFAIAAVSQDLPVWLDCLVRMFEFLRASAV